jgi:hypothetical protein
MQLDQCLLLTNLNFNDLKQLGGQERWNRGVNMGHGLQRMSQARRGKLPVVITEGNIRPLVPLVAAKFATECNIAARNHVPMLKHWKEYNKHPALINLFMGRLRVSTFPRPVTHLDAIRNIVL